MTGRVSLLGAGPGDVELITVKGARRLKEADVVVYDRLVNKDLLRATKASCELIDVGKKTGNAKVSQAEIEDILINKAREGKDVVRLKSGDPYIFGRGGEEAQALLKAGISFEVVPGLSSAIAGPAYAGVPVTYRDVATSFHVFTGHLKDETESLNWQAISQLKGTLVFLMGMKQLPTILEQLRSHGYPKETPIAIIEWATHPQQRSIDGNLETISAKVQEKNIQAPSIIVVGDVVHFRDDLNFYENLPLVGKRIFLQESQNGRLPKTLKDDGATLVTFPTRTTVKKIAFDLPDFEAVTGLIFPDIKSWDIFVEELHAQKRDIRALGNLKIIGVGHHTAQYLEKSGIILDGFAKQLDDQELRDMLDSFGGKWYMLAPDFKAKEFKHVAACDLLMTHEVVFDRPLEADQWQDLDIICLPNSLAALNFVDIVKSTHLGIDTVPIIVMGDSTRGVLEEAGFTTIVESDEATILSMRDKCRELSN